MAGYFRDEDVPWRVQPQVAVQKSSTSPGLIAAFEPAIDGRVNGRTPTSVLAAQTVGKHGRGLAFSGGNKKSAWAFDAALASAVTSPNGFAIAILLDVNTLTNYGGLISLQDGTTTNAAFEIRIGSSATDSNLQVLRAGAGGFRAHDTGSGRLIAGDRSRVVVFSFPDNTITNTGTAYVDGIAYPVSFDQGGGGVGTGAVGVPTSGGLTLGGRGPDAATYLDGNIYSVRLWGRGLLAAEVPKTPQDMFSLYQPMQRRIWVPVTAGGGTTISGTLGTATATGLTATVNANRTIAGALGTATATGFTGTVNANRTIAGALGAAVASGLQGNVNANRTIAGALGVAAASGFTGTVSNTNDTVIGGALGIAIASGLMGGVNANRTIPGSLGVAVATGLTGAVSNSSNTVIAGALGSAVASGLTGTVANSGDTVIGGSLGIAIASGLMGNVSAFGVLGSLAGSSRKTGAERVNVQSSTRSSPKASTHGNRQTATR